MIRGKQIVGRMMAMMKMMRMTNHISLLEESEMR